MNTQRGYLSISDDDLCSECARLNYTPGGLSLCILADPEWPAEFDADGYAKTCSRFKENDKSSESPTFTCPECKRTSYHPKDVEHQYCGACDKFFQQCNASCNDTHWHDGSDVKAVIPRSMANGRPFYDQPVEYWCAGCRGLKRGEFKYLRGPK